MQTRQGTLVSIRSEAKKEQIRQEIATAPQNHFIAKNNDQQNGITENTDLRRTPYTKNSFDDQSAIKAYIELMHIPIKYKMKTTRQFLILSKGINLFKKLKQIKEKQKVGERKTLLKHIMSVINIPEQNSNRRNNWKENGHILIVGKDSLGSSYF